MKYQIPGTFKVGDSDFIIDLYSYDANSSDHLNFDIFDKTCRFKKAYDTVQSSSGRTHLMVISNYFDTGLLSEIKQSLQIHSLSLEDIVNTTQRSKHETYSTYELCIIKMLSALSKESDQISLITIKNLVIVFNPKETVDFCIDNICCRITERTGRICERDSGYLTYSILDSIVDSLFDYSEALENNHEILDDMIEDSSVTNNRDLYEFKKKCINFKKHIWPLREMVNSIMKDDKSILLKDKRNAMYFRDLQDHVSRVIDNADILRDSAYSLIEMQMNVNSSKMNEVVKMLTVITTIFTPIMFMSSVYGMNFDFIPEIHIHGGYIWFWIFVGIVTSIQLAYFKKKKWL
jgi:magnesium transporter